MVKKKLAKKKERFISESIQMIKNNFFIPNIQTTLLLQ
ncbi:MAG: hypothetical protein RL329_460 [Bacteroidota bacterium]